MGNEQQNKGMLDQVQGTIKEGVGNVTGDEQMKREGQVDQVKGDIREGVGDAKQAVDKAAQDLKKV